MHIFSKTVIKLIAESYNDFNNNSIIIYREI